MRTLRKNTTNHLLAEGLNMPDEKENPTIGERVTALETDMTWIKKAFEKIDRRTWWILGSVVGLGLIAILIALAGKTPV